MDTIDGVVSIAFLKDWFEGYAPTDPIFTEVVLLDGMPMNQAHIEDGFVILSHNSDFVKGTSGETLHRYLSYVLNVTSDVNRNFPIFIETPQRTKDNPLWGISRVREGTLVLTSMGFIESEATK